MNSVVLVNKSPDECLLFLHLTCAMTLAAFAGTLAMIAFCGAFAIGPNACAKRCGDQSVDAMLAFACATTMTLEQGHIGIDTCACATSATMVAPCIIGF